MLETANECNMHGSGSLGRKRQLVPDCLSSHSFFTSLGRWISNTEMKTEEGALVSDLNCLHLLKSNESSSHEI